MSHAHSRYIPFESVPNFRDLGGYRTRDGRTVAWRRLFRSGALHKMDERDIARLKEEIGPRAVINLRSPKDPDRDPEPFVVEKIGARHYPIPFRPDNSSYVHDEVQAHPHATDMGQIYLNRISERLFGQRVIDALEIIADRGNHPLVFHCSAGKDRTGVLAAMVLAAMGVVDEDVVEDYILSAPFMKAIRARLSSDPETAEGVKVLPEFQWDASAESMTAFLSLLGRDYGSVDGYLSAYGASTSLVDRLKAALLVEGRVTGQAP